MERQNVKLCIQLFDEKTITALEVTGHKEDNIGTIQFLKIILRWWCCVNVKSKLKGHVKRDSYQNPVYSINDHNIKFLETLVDWLDKWDKLEVPGCDNKSKHKRNGKLTTETQFSFTHTTKTLILLSKYLLEKLNFDYVLLGKF